MCAAAVVDNLGEKLWASTSQVGLGFFGGLVLPWAAGGLSLRGMGVVLRWGKVRGCEGAVGLRGEHGVARVIWMA